MKDSEFVTRSVLSGVLISIGVFVYGNTPNKIIGALLFSIALLTILSFGCPLYTGAVGYYKDEKDGHVYGFMPSWRKDLPKETE